VSVIFDVPITHELPSQNGSVDGTPKYTHRNAVVGWMLDPVDRIHLDAVQRTFKIDEADSPPWTRVYAGVVVRQIVDTEGRASWIHRVVLAGEVVAEYSISSTGPRNLGYEELTIRILPKAPFGYNGDDFPGNFEWVIGRAHRVTAHVQILMGTSPEISMDTDTPPEGYPPMALPEDYPPDRIIIDQVLTSNAEITIPPPVGKDPIADANLFLNTFMDGMPAWNFEGIPGSVLYPDFLRAVMPYHLRRPAWVNLNQTAQYDDESNAVFMKSDVNAEASAVYSILTDGETGNWSVKNPPSQVELYKRVSRLIRTLKSKGVWKLLDRLFVFRADSQANALFDWKSPQALDRRAVNEGATFDPVQGFRRTASGGYVNTRFNPNTNGVKFKLDSACAGAVVFTDTVSATTGYVFGCASGADAFFIKQNSISGDAQYATNETSTALTGGGAMPTGAPAVTRTTSNKTAVYNNGAAFGIRAAAPSSAVPNADMYVCAHNDNGTATGGESEWVMSFFCGAELSVGQYALLTSVLRSYISGV